MKNKLLVITALLSAGSIFCAQQQPTVLPIECSDGKLYIQESTLLKFKFFAGMAESFNCPLSEIELKPTPTKDYSLVCSVRKNVDGKLRFYIDCTATVMKLLVDFIETSKELFEDDRETLMARIQSLSYQDLVSFLKIADQLVLQEPYLTHLEQLLIPVFRNPEIIQAFLHDGSVQELVGTCYNLDWNGFVCPRFIAASLDNTISIKDYPALGNYGDDIESSVFSPDGTRIATTRSLDENVTITDIVTGKPVCTIDCGRKVLSMVFSPDGKRIAIAKSWDREVIITDITTGKSVDTINYKYSKEPKSLVFSPDGKCIVTDADEKYNTVKVTDIVKNEIIISISHERNINCAAFSPDGKSIATGSNDGIVKVTDIATNDIILCIYSLGRVKSIVFSPDGKCIATGSEDGTVEIIDIATRKKPYIICEYDYFSAESIAFSPDGKCIAIAFYEKVMIVDIVTDSFFTIYTNRFGNFVAFSPDGRFLLVHNRCIPIEQYNSVQSVLIDALVSNDTPFCYEQLSPNMQQLLFTLPEDLRNQLVTDVPEQQAVMHQTPSHQVDDNPIPLKYRCPSGEHDTRQDCCGCTFDDVD